MSRRYPVTFDEITISAAQDIFEIYWPANTYKALRVLRQWLNVSDTTLPSSGFLPLRTRLLGSVVTHGSAGGTPIIGQEGFGDVAASFTAKCNNTTKANNNVAAPGALTAADGGGGGNLSAGAYLYRVTFVTASGETAGGTESGTVTLAASHKMSLTNIPTGNPGVTSRNIYRTVAGGATSTEHFAFSIADNTTTTATDNIADGSLTTAYPTSGTATYQIITCYQDGFHLFQGHEFMYDDPPALVGGINTTTGGSFVFELLAPPATAIRFSGGLLLEEIG